MEERFRPADPRTTKSPKAKGSSVKHKTRSPADAVRQSEQSLRQLLEDFEGGRLNAFGMCVCERLGEGYHLLTVYLIPQVTQICYNR